MLKMTRSVPVLLGFLAFLSAVSATAQDLCLQGCPVGSPATNTTIQRPIYVLNNNGKTKFADWVAYQVTKDTIGPTKKRLWKIDPDLNPSETLAPSDYQGVREVLNSDRGHQAPLASLTGTPHWETANYLSNITPQKAALNQGPWERLESAERDLARLPNVNAVYTVTGPLYEQEMTKLPKAKLDHTVPSGYWKIIAVQAGNTISTAGFIFHQETARNANYCNYHKTVGEIEERTKLTFFPRLTKTAHERIAGEGGQLLSALGC